MPYFVFLCPKKYIYFFVLRLHVIRNRSVFFRVDDVHTLNRNRVKLKSTKLRMIMLLDSIPALNCRSWQWSNYLGTLGARSICRLTRCKALSDCVIKKFCWINDERSNLIWLLSTSIYGICDLTWYDWIMFYWSSNVRFERKWIPRNQHTWTGLTSLFLFNSRTEPAGAIIGLLLVFTIQRIWIVLVRCVFFKMCFFKMCF